MTITINRKLSKKELNTLLAKFEKKTKKKDIFQFFGKAVEKIDALEFQKKARDEWN